MRFALLLTVAILIVGLGGKAAYQAMLFTGKDIGKGAEVVPGLSSAVDDRFTAIRAMINGGDAGPKSRISDEKSELTPQEQYARRQKFVEPSAVESNPFLQP